MKITAMILENTFMSLPRLIPTAFPILTPFSWLCHQKWESYLKVGRPSSITYFVDIFPPSFRPSQVPKIPKSIRVLMLGGAIDEVVPHAQMQGLWALIRSRPSVPRPSQSSQISSADRELVEEFLKTAAATASEPEDTSGGPPVYVDQGDKYMEFPAGGHSGCLPPFPNFARVHRC